MRARRLPPSALLALPSGELVGVVLLAPVTLPDGTIRKGTRLTQTQVEAIVAAARLGGVTRPLRVAWPEAGDVHEDDAAARLAAAVSGAGIELRPPRQSRIDLTARWAGVLHIRVDALGRLNAVDPIEVFTLYHGQAVTRGQVVAAVKVAPHLLPETVVLAGVEGARGAAPIVDVRPYLVHDVAAIAQESITGDALTRFEAGARRKVESLGSRFAGTLVIGDEDPEAAEEGAVRALTEVVRERGIGTVLVGGVSAGDPLSPFYAALERLGGRLLRRGVPAHPGSMIWLAELDGARLLGLPQCGMFTLATAADLVLPRLLTGEALTAADLADLGHGGLLGKEMRFRFPAYAQDLPAPEG